MKCFKETDYVDMEGLEKQTASRRMVIKQIQYQLQTGIGSQTSKFLANNRGVAVMAHEFL